jgi:hypothetical protein
VWRNVQQGGDGAHYRPHWQGERYSNLNTAVTNAQISNTIDSILASKPTDERELSVTEVQGRKHLLALSENVISLIWCLAEASHKTLAAVNGAHVEGLLIKVVEGRELVGPGVVLAAGTSLGCLEVKPNSSAAQAMYSLSQDNPPFTQALFRHPTGVQAIVAAVEADHAAAETELAKRSKAMKGKGKKGEANGAEASDLPDGRALLARVSLAGELAPTLRRRCDIRS